MERWSEGNRDKRKGERLRIALFSALFSIHKFLQWEVYRCRETLLGRWGVRVGRLLDGRIASTERGNSAAFVGAGPDPDDGHVIRARRRGASACGLWVRGRAGRGHGVRLAFNIPLSNSIAVSSPSLLPLPLLSYILLAHSLARSLIPSSCRIRRARPTEITTREIACEMVKQIHNLVLTRSHAKEAFGFRIIGGKEQGLTFKVRRLHMMLIFL